MKPHGVGSKDDGETFRLGESTRSKNKYSNKYRLRAVNSCQKNLRLSSGVILILSQKVSDRKTTATPAKKLNTNIPINPATVETAKNTQRICRNLNFR